MSGLLLVGSQLSANSSLASIPFSWSRLRCAPSGDCSGAVQLAAGQTYTPTADDVGHYLEVTALGQTTTPCFTFGCIPTAIPLSDSTAGAVGPVLNTQTISFPATVVTYGALHFSPAIASSGLAVTYSNPTGECTVSSMTLIHITVRGRASSQPASQPGDSTSVSVATPVTKTFTINPAPVHVDAIPSSVTEGQPDPVASAALRASDFVNGDTASSARSPERPPAGSLLTGPSRASTAA